jgi:glycine hydroxymethyltransferase
MLVTEFQKAEVPFFSTSLKESDPVITYAIEAELQRQQDHIELVASENIASKAVLEAQGSVLGNKYADSYPGHRPVGCRYDTDKAEAIAIERACRLFHCSYANVQPHSGTQANQAVFFALLKPGDTLMGLHLDQLPTAPDGNAESQLRRWFKPVSYGFEPGTCRIDYERAAKIAAEARPKLIIAGGPTYPRIIDFARFREIADSVGAYLMVDMGQFAGLVAGGVYPSPLDQADVVTATTHKTLRGPRGGMILSRDAALGNNIAAAVFPRFQGGPLLHVIAAKAVAFREALAPDFADYARRLVTNAKMLATTLTGKGFDIVSGGTDTHLIIIDLRSKGITGSVAEAALGRAGLTCDKYRIPFDPATPQETSGIRLGTAAATTRGFGEPEFEQVGHMIAELLNQLSLGQSAGNARIERRIAEQVRGLCQRFPTYKEG